MKKSFLQIITLALCVVNLVISAILVFTCMPAISNTNNLVVKICEIIDLDVTGVQGGAQIVDVANLEEVPVTFSGNNDIALNLKTDVDGKPHIVKLGVSIVVDKSHADYKAKRANIDTAMSMINGIIIDVVSKYTVNQVNNNKEEIRKEILGQVQTLFNSEFIYDITFTNFVTQ